MDSIMSSRSFLLPTALSGFLAVALGAFGAHALKGSIDTGFYAAFQTAVQYQFYHTLALLFVILAGKRLPETASKVACWGFLLGILLFSGSLYLMAVTGVRTLGIVTPFGGVSFLVGWAAMVYAALKTE